MQLNTIRERLSASLKTDDARRAFEDGRARHQALEHFADAPSMVEALNRRGRERADERSEVTRAAIAEAQRDGTHACWSSALLTAFAPALRRIAGAAMYAWRGFTEEEVAAAVVESFYEALDAFPLKTQGARAVVNLVLNTRKRVMRRLSRDATPELPCEADLLEQLSPERTLGAPSPEELLLLGERAQRCSPERLRAFLRELCRGESEADITLLLETAASDVPLIRWVEMHHPELDEEARMREYGRLRRRRSRLMKRIARRVRELRAPDMLTALTEHASRRSA